MMFVLVMCQEPFFFQFAECILAVLFQRHESFVLGNLLSFVLRWVFLGFYINFLSLFADTFCAV